MTTRFRTLRRHLAPAWLTTDEGELVGYALDVIKDVFIERVRLGLMARLPQNDPTGATTAPPDALAAMGRDRRVVRGIAESGVSYAARLIAWLDDRKTAGNPFALMRKLAEYTGPLASFRTVDMRGNWYSRAADGTLSFALNQGNWDWDDTDASRWSRFWVIIYPHGLWSAEDAWGTGTWGDDGAWGSTATPDEVSTIRSLIADWKPAGTLCVNVIQAFGIASLSPAAPEPDGTWGHWHKIVAGAGAKARLVTARYWNGSLNV